MYFRKKNGADAPEEAIFIEPNPSKRSDNNNKISSSDCARSPEMFPKGTSLLFRHLSNTLKSTFKCRATGFELKKFIIWDWIGTDYLSRLRS